MPLSIEEKKSIIAYRVQKADSFGQCYHESLEFGCKSFVLCCLPHGFRIIDR